MSAYYKGETREVCSKNFEMNLMIRLLSHRVRMGLLMFSCSLLGSCQASALPENEVPMQTIEALADEYVEAMLVRYPSLATTYDIAAGDHDRLFDNSLASLALWHEQEDAWLSRLLALEVPAMVGSRDWVTYGFLREELSSSKATRVCRNELWETSTTTGWYTEVPFIFDIQPVETQAEKVDALTRLAAVDQYVDTEIGNLRLGLELGYSSPRLTVEAVSTQVRSLLQEDNPFLNMGRRAADEIFAKAVSQIYKNEIVPALNRFADFIEREYLPAARTEIALSYNPDGANCYPALIRSFATISVTPEEVHRLGLKQVAVLRNEMTAILEKHFDAEPLGGFLRRINQAPEFTFRSEQAVLDYSVASLDDARSSMSEVFDLLPRADVLIKPYPDFAASGSGEYHSSSEDGKRPGIYYIAVREPEQRTQATQQSTLYHETYPGHHLQGAIALELGDKVHDIARYLWNSGYGEGWALYAERLAEELDLYSRPLDKMGLLSDQSARAVRLVIDSGIHTKGWSRQEALEYMLDNCGWSRMDIENEIDRYISWPGQANAYMLGMLEIKRLRNFAEVQLGERFDLRTFHRRILENGSMTLPMVEQVVLNWVKQAKVEAD